MDNVFTMFARINPFKKATGAQETFDECIRAIGILENKPLPAELRDNIVIDDLAKNVSSSKEHARSPLFIALTELAKVESPVKLHQEMYAEYLSLWEQREKTSFRIVDADSYAVLEVKSQAARLAIEHLVFDQRGPLNGEANYSFHALYAFWQQAHSKWKINSSNSLKTICYRASWHETEYSTISTGISQFRSRLQMIIPGAIATLETVVLEIPREYKQGQNFDQKDELDRLGFFLGTKRTTENAPNGDIVFIWKAPFQICDDRMPAREKSQDSSWGDGLPCCWFWPWVCTFGY